MLLAWPFACTVGPDYQRPEPELPAGWHAAPEGADPAEIDAWWSWLGDPRLTELIERARAGNLDLRTALWRVEAARAARDVTRGEWFPDVDGSGSYERSRLSANGPFAPPSTPLAPAGVSNRNFASIAVDASWEIDVFGRVRRSVEAADADLEATVEDARDVQVILLADVAETYVEALALRARLEIARRNTEAQARTLELTRSRRRAELAPALDVAQAESNLALTRSEIPALEAAQDDALYRLALLLGGAPGVAHDLVDDPSIPAPPPLVGLGLPTDVLLRRPDLRAAERRLAAESARIGVAVADLYPRFSLTGGYGYESLDTSQTLDSDSRTFYVGPSFRWNLFDGGRVRGNVRRQDALAERARVEFEAAVLRALQEIESSVSAFRRERERAGHLDAAARAAETAVGYVRDLYREGLTDFQNVLDAERTLFRSQDQAADSRGAVARAWIRIYRALGGGWTADAMVEAGPGDAARDPEGSARR